MDFNQLMAKMRELDQPTPAPAPMEACGDSPMAGPVPPMDAMPQQQPPSHPSMSVNLNAQGMDNIASLMKLMTKVNPDMINQPTAPMASPMAMLTAPGPSISSIGDLGNLDAGPLKMLPNLDKDNDMTPPSQMDLPSGHDKDHDMVKALDVDMDGDHDMDDHDAEKDDADSDDEKKETYANSAEGGADQQYSDVNYMVNKLAGGMNRPKATFPKVADGDNPMQRVESVDLKTSIKNELRNRLAEAKGSKKIVDSKQNKKSYKKGDE